MESALFLYIVLPTSYIFILVLTICLCKMTAKSEKEEYEQVRANEGQTFGEDH